MHCGPAWQNGVGSVFLGFWEDYRSREDVFNSRKQSWTIDLWIIGNAGSLLLYCSGLIFQFCNMYSGEHSEKTPRPNLYCGEKKLCEGTTLLQWHSTRKQLWMKDMTWQQEFVRDPFECATKRGPNAQREIRSNYGKRWLVAKSRLMRLWIHANNQTLTLRYRLCKERKRMRCLHFFHSSVFSRRFNDCPFAIFSKRKSNS